MLVVDINGEHEARELEELETLLTSRIDNGVNSFWLFSKNQEYPKLAIVVKEKLAVVHYFPEANHAGYQSLGSSNELDPAGKTIFCISRYRADDIEVLNSAVLLFPAALEAAKEFFSSSELPRTIKWFEL
jgi:hypothetical protein